MECKGCPVKDPDRCRLWGWKNPTGCSDTSVDWEFRAMVQKQKREGGLSKHELNTKIRAKKALERG